MSSNHIGYRLVYGAGSTIGSAIAKRWQHEPLLLTARDPQPLAEQFPNAEVLAFNPLADDPSVLTNFLNQYQVSQAISCVGGLHGDGLVVEKSLQQLSTHAALHSMQLNALSFATLAQALAKQLKRQQPLTLAVLSAKIGSITDNQLGGWYSYRMSKAALNMLVKDIAIEWRRKGEHKVLAIHPGTTKSPLTEPFAGNIDPNKYWTAEVSAERIETVMNTATESGLLYNWDGTPLPF
ncbi:SDR family NAD(P)-dependent oxidoreductase [Salinibius halmophilus]|uniref:SDR family NAD(P)-dependent oxidoreductase n=1 Tax=Salinibius halmophilus TaxID=1853216 RepID=UPI000E6680A7|nr:SDR family NAD(P)-dependent oxidoreductase [Salinibius halmophilus]